MNSNNGPNSLERRIVSFADIKYTAIPKGAKTPLLLPRFPTFNHHFCLGTFDKGAVWEDGGVESMCKELVAMGKACPTAPMAVMEREWMRPGSDAKKEEATAKRERAGVERERKAAEKEAAKAERERAGVERKRKATDKKRKKVVENKRAQRAKIEKSKSQLTPEEHLEQYRRGKELFAAFTAGGGYFK